ncbi:hypothetical protein DENSPDRAFT_15606 [Dentipellis sp. KUC8613]|nr:hypothetical protein DENSPDRAFT_15606 [Dentipellis sp. KUC8613]
MLRAIRLGVVRDRRFRVVHLHWSTQLSVALVFFFLCRYCMLISLTGLIVSMSIKQQIDCAALYTFNAVTGNLTIITATTVLMIRTIVMWKRNLIVSMVLGVIGLAHWIILWRAMFIIDVVWDPSVSTCVVVSTKPVYLQVTFFFTMIFDLLILILAAAKVLHRTCDFDVWALLFDEGLVFFLVAGLSNILPAVFGILNLNSVMNLITTIPASVVTAIAACRTVVQLPEVQADLFINVSSIVGDNTTVRHIHAQRRTVQHGVTSEVRINTEMIVMEDWCVFS